MKLRIIGVPSNVGALNRGTELGPSYFRNGKLIETLQREHEVIDLGDIKIDNESYRHNHGPIRNWPAPLLMWDEVGKVDELFKEHEFTIVIGGGCSILTGVFRNFFKVYGKKAELLSIDHHIDMKVPFSEQCVGATAFTLYFLTHKNQWVSPIEGFTNKKITAMGFDPETIDESYSLEGVNMYEKALIASHPEKIAKAYLSALPDTSRVLLHLDLDVIRDQELSSVYMPSPNGLEFSTLTKLLKHICHDTRIAGMVITEFSPKSSAEKEVEKIIEMLREIIH